MRLERRGRGGLRGVGGGNLERILVEGRGVSGIEEGTRGLTRGWVGHGGGGRGAS